ncbi:MAG: hypothetical protein JXO49_08140 [Deltaproteobacteria bacterium]|nr:hypothetical protein [Candidatus Anaeroferrophillus wilburensis]MBN2889295.1 hypothetical protein [Deltaproteobacteria bacterium]
MCRTDSLRFVTLAVALLLLAGCAVDRGAVVIGSSAPQPPYHEVKKGGPPPWAPAHGRNARQHEYRYYPSSYVYFEASRGLYFYFADGHWQAGISLPVGIHLDIDEYVSLELATEYPYEHFVEHRQAYPPGKHKEKKKKKH